MPAQISEQEFRILIILKMYQKTGKKSLWIWDPCGFESSVLISSVPIWSLTLFGTFIPCET